MIEIKIESSAVMLIGIILLAIKYRNISNNFDDSNSIACDLI